MGMLYGKVAVITGAGSGMARAAALFFAEQGAKVVAADISGEEKETAAEAGDAVVPVHCDVSKEADVMNAFDTALEQFGRVDAVLNAAGIPGPAVPFAELTREDWDSVINVDLWGVVLGIKHGVRAMMANGNGGAIVNWSSIAGNTPYPGVPLYSIAKTGVIGATKSAAQDYGPMNIRVNAICPGIIRTKMGQDAIDMIPGIAEKPPMQRVGESIEAAHLVAFLVSDLGAYVSGAIIPLDGGWSVRAAL